MAAKLQSLIIRGFGVILSLADILGFISALIAIWQGTADYVNYIIAFIVAATLPAFLHLSTYALNDEDKIKRTIFLLYSILMSVLFCGTYVVCAYTVIESPSTFFGFIADLGKQERVGSAAFHVYIPLISLSVMYILSYWLLQHYTSRIDRSVAFYASVPILIVFGFIIIKYIAFGELRPLMQSAKSLGDAGWLSVIYSAILTTLFIFRGLSPMLRGIRLIPDKVA